MKTLTNEGSEIISLIQRNGNWRDKHMAYVLKKLQLQFYVFINTLNMWYWIM